MSDNSTRNFTAEDSPELVEAGGYFGRKTGSVPIAVSNCTFQVPGENHINSCIAALVQFEDYLRRRERKYVHYEWANIVRHGTRFALDILWYDSDFFSERKDAFLVGAHPLAVARFGCRPSDLNVVHYGPKNGR